MQEARPGYLRKLISGRIVVILAVAYICGIALTGLVMAGFNGAYLLCGMLLILIITAIFQPLNIGFFKTAMIVVTVAAGGFSFYFSLQQQPGGLEDYAGVPLNLEGTVVEEALHHEDHSIYRLRVDLLETRQGEVAVSGTVLVKVYAGGEESYSYGERLRLRGIIVEPQGRRNPGGFDYRFYLKSQGVDALFYPRAGMISAVGEGDLGFLASGAFKLRRLMVSAISAALPEPSAGMLSALLFGSSAFLPPEIADNFRRAGVGHLMAVSGLHVGLVALLTLGLLRKLKLKGRLPLILAVIAVFAYAYLTGMRPSALRAAIMASMAMAALLLDRENDLPTAVASAAMVTLFINPLLLFNVGFQLSYAATIFLIYAYRPLEKLLKAARFPAFLRPLTTATLAAQAGVLPLCCYYFNYLPLGALFFNLLLMPLIVFLLGLGLSGALLAIVAPHAGSILLWASRPLLEAMIYITALSNRDWLYIAFRPLDPSLLVFYYIFFVILLLLYYRWEGESESESNISFSSYLSISLGKLLFSQNRHRRTAVIFILLTAVAFTWSGVLFPGEEELKITFIDVGQGAAALIETPCGSVIMIDAGGEPAYRGDPGAIGERVLKPLLRKAGMRSIDLAVISHPHEDHFGGYIALLDEIAIKKFLLSPVEGESPFYDQLLEDAALLGIDIARAEKGQVWSCGDTVVLEVIWPPAQLMTGTGSDLNNNSVVIVLNHGQVRFLFTGDIEDAAAEALLGSGVDLQADLFLVPHHGGYMAAMPAMLAKVRPSLAIIQVGRNSFGHPHLSTIEALEAAGTEIYRNDYHGAIIVESNGFEIKVRATVQPALAWR